MLTRTASAQCAIVLLTSIICGAVAVSGAFARSDKRIVRETHDMDPLLEMPSDLAAAVAAADLVALVRVGGDKTTVDDPVPTTEYNLDVLEVFASGPGVPIGRSISVAILGGTVDRGDFLLEWDVPGFPLTAGHSYLAFLQWHEGRQQFVPVYGPDSFWSVQSGRIVVKGSKSLSGRFQNRLAPDVLNQVRLAAANRPRQR